MNDLVYFEGMGGCFNHNIEMFRDLFAVIDYRRMVNAYDTLSWGIRESGRLVVMIDNHHKHGANNVICIEFQGDGVMTIYKTDSYGNKIDDNYEQFDIHWCGYGVSSHEKFSKLLKDKFDVVIR